MDPYFSDVMTITDVYRYPTQHYEHHRRQLTTRFARNGRRHQLRASSCPGDRRVFAVFGEEEPDHPLGFRFHGSVLDAIASVAVLVALAESMSALFGRIGDQVRRPDVVQFAGMMIMMPFMFVSGAFAPLATMPAWMRTMAAFNPVAHATDALRANVLGTATAREAAMALAAAAALVGARHPHADRAARVSDGLPVRGLRTRARFELRRQGQVQRSSPKCSTCWCCCSENGIE